MKYYTFAKHKANFDKGYGLTGYVKYLIALFGLSTLDAKTTLIAGACYGVFCYFLGWYWYKKRIVDAEREVQNRYDPFVREMRELSGSGRFK